MTKAADGCGCDLSRAGDGARLSAILLVALAFAVAITRRRRRATLSLRRTRRPPAR